MLPRGNLLVYLSNKEAVLALIRPYAIGAPILETLTPNTFKDFDDERLVFFVVLLLFAIDDTYNLVCVFLLRLTLGVIEPLRSRRIFAPHAFAAFEPFFNFAIFVAKKIGRPLFFS